MTVGERIRKARENAGFDNAADFASRINVSKQTLYKYENNITTNIPSDKIEAVAKLTHVSPAYLMGWEEAPNKTISNLYNISTQSIPMLGEIACGQPKYALEERESYILEGTDIKCDFCLRAKGDSMINARIEDGDIVFIRKQDIVNNGEIAAVIIDDEATLKRFYYYREKNLVILKPENPKYEDIILTDEALDHVHVLGKAVAFQSDVR